MKTCPVCQKIVTDQAKFCYYCGASLLNVAPDAPAPEVEQPVEEAAAEAFEAPVAPVEEPIAETVEEAVETIEEPIADAVEEAVEEPVEAVQEAVETVEEPVEKAVEEAVEEPVFEPVEEPAAEPVEEPVFEPEPAPVVTPVVPPVVPREAPVQPPVAQTVVAATDSRSLMTTAGYIFTTILFSIPVIGLIFMLVWGCGKPKNISRKRFSLACLIMRLIGVILFLLIAVVVLVLCSEKIPGWYHSIFG